MDYVNAEQSPTQRSLLPMSDINTSDVNNLGERLDLLETRLTFQDETIETLNKTITDQWLKIDALTRQLANMSERLQAAEAQAPGASNEPPPHY